MKVLVIDIGGTNIKVASTDRPDPIKIPSGPAFTPQQLVKDVLAATRGWKYDRISIGYPSPVSNDSPILEPINLGPGWVKFDYRKAFGKPYRFINDAAMQALGGYQGGRMLYMGLGTGLGTAMIFDGVIIPLETAHLPYKKLTYEDYVGVAGLQRRGKKRWRQTVLEVIELLRAALICDYVLLGGGNAKLMEDILPSGVILGANSNAIEGGLKLWTMPDPSRHPLAAVAINTKKVGKSGIKKAAKSSKKKAVKRGK